MQLHRRTLAQLAFRIGCSIRGRHSGLKACTARVARLSASFSWLPASQACVANSAKFISGQLRQVQGMASVNQHAPLALRILRCSWHWLQLANQPLKSEIPEIVSNCTKKFMVNLPNSIKTVIFLSNSDAYVLGCQNILRTLFPKDFRLINPMSSFADGRGWVHVAHASGLNGHSILG